MKRIHIHWTAGSYNVSNLDKQHYHFIIAGDGTVVEGVYKPEDNENCSDGKYAAHTKGANTGAIGVAMAAMHNAIENPFESGKYPLKEHQWDKMCQLVATLCKQYKIKITPQTVLTHAEIQPTLGIKQNGKWDITRISFKPNLKGHKACGDYLRQQVQTYM